MFRGGHLDVDVLSDVLELLEPHGQAACMSELTAPWGLDFSAMAAFFHVVQSGHCVLLPPGGARAIRVGAGDVVLVPSGMGHRMGSSATTRMASHQAIVDKHWTDGTDLLRFGGGGAAVSMFCGIARIRNPSGLRMLSILPPVIHVRGEAGRVAKRLDTIVHLLLSEAQRSQPGSFLAASRLFDLLFVELVRIWLATLPEGGGGWMGALRDPQIGVALAALHGAPGHPWSVPELAAKVGMSRSPFADRFTKLVGQPPLRYLARWRMLLAARLLRSDENSVRQVAASVGYDAAEAFARAFKRDFGLSPAGYRRAAARGDEPTPTISQETSNPVSIDTANRSDS